MKIQHFLILMLVLSCSWLGAEGIRLSSQTPDELIVEFELPEYSLEHIQNSRGTWQRLTSEHGSVDAVEGKPLLRIFSEAVGVPVDGDISVQIISSQTTTFKNVNLWPAEMMVVDGEEVRYEFYQDPQVYNTNNPYPALIVEKGDPAFIGDRRFVPLRIRPFQYKALSKELVVYDNIRIRVGISGTKEFTKGFTFSSNPIDAAADAFFINNASSKNWRLPRQRDFSYQAPKNAVNGVNAIQLIVDEDGIYKVDRAYLQEIIDNETELWGVEMAWDLATVDPRRLELKDKNGSVPIHFVGEEDGRFDHTDHFEFFGRRHAGENSYMDTYTEENVYTLYLKDGLGARMAVENGGLVQSNPASFIAADAFESTVHFEEQFIRDKLGKCWIDKQSREFERDTWFWKRITAPNLEIIPFELEYPIGGILRTASAKVVLHGLTYVDTLVVLYDHEATVRINQGVINTHRWRGQTEQVFVNQAPIPNSFLMHGTNNLFVSLSGNTPMGDKEQVLLDYFEVKYWREYKTDKDRLLFTKPSHRPGSLYQFELNGFSSGDVSVYKIGSSIFSNMQIEPFDTEDMAPWSVTFQDSVASTEIQYYACTEDQKMPPKFGRLDISSDLKNPQNQADIIIISRRDLLYNEGTDMIVDLYESEGHSVARVDFQDILDEFNGGIRAAQPIKDFLTYAYNNWAEPSLQHVLLLGEGVFDERDFSPARQYAVLPVKMVWTYKAGATGSDNWYACIVGEDPVPDISIARINVWEVEQILPVAEKMVAYREQLNTNQLWNSHLIFATGGKIEDETDTFAQQSERMIRRCIPEEYRVTRVYTATTTVSPEYFGGTYHLKEAINSGAQYMQFIGHGGGRVWADYNLFNFNDVATLNNQCYPVVLSLSCYASAFDTYGMSSLSEALVLQPNKGAISTLGFIGLGYLYQDEEWGLSLTEALFKHDFPSAGQAVQFALARYYSLISNEAPRYALTDGAAYLGDPLIRLKRPVKNDQVSLNSHVLSHGDTLRVSATFPPDVTAAKLFIFKPNGVAVNVPYDLPVINGSYNADYTIPLEPSGPQVRSVYVAGYSADNEYIGITSFGVGRPDISHVSLDPAVPTWRDSVAFKARVHSPSSIVSMRCMAKPSSAANWQTFPMRYDAGQDLWITGSKFEPNRTGREISFKYVLVVEKEDEESGEILTETFESPVQYYVVAGPDLFVEDAKLEFENNSPVLRVLVSNIGNAASIPAVLRVSSRAVGDSLWSHVNDKEMAAYEVYEQRWETVNLTGLTPGMKEIKVFANATTAFTEWNIFINSNNELIFTLPFNYHTVENDGKTISSLDGNLECEVPANLVPAGRSALFTINDLGNIDPNNQPDIHRIALRSSDGAPEPVESIAYEVRTLDESLVDSTGVFVGGNRIKLTFSYSARDPDTQAQESEDSYRIYRWDERGRKWILQGGIMAPNINKVAFEVRRQGIYALYRNRDLVRPTIDVNVQDQEFTVGGYISGKGIISLLLSDANGIDVFDDSIKLYMDGVQIPPEDYVISINLENINRIPIKYQLDLRRGNYTLVVDCKDVNGNFNTREVQFVVSETFGLTRVGNYPNPVLGRAEDPRNDGRTRFTYVLTDDADQVTIKVYTVAGRLVRTFKNLPTGVGYHEYPRTLHGWDCTDELGFPLANGVYFYKIIAKKGGKTLEKTMKMAILK
ncbi:MAG TPA: hypothetical protein GX398_02880 [Candidatus Cloacimonetes bacterium]|nr:hypothetical protein [Candidatus Cloacimonadota bacterium]